MRTTLDISDELYRQAKVKAALENRKIKDIVSEGLSLVLGLAPETPLGRARRMTNAPGPFGRAMKSPP